MKKIRIHDKVFEPYISEAEIQESIKRVAAEIRKKHFGNNPIFIGVLNGSFYFAADLMKHIDFDCEISFVKVASYQGIHSTGNVRQLIGLDQSIKGRDVIILEDIVDTGNTIEAVVEQIETMGAATISVATLLFKPEEYKKEVEIKYVALEIPSKFVVGYGLDYDGLGRNLNELYVLSEEQKLKENNNTMNIVIFGPPGAGKGTQASRLKDKCNLKHLSTGDILRAEIEKGSDLGKLAKDFMSKGELVPDELVINMIEICLHENKDLKGFIFDGFPRTTAQARALDNLLEENNTEIDYMLSLEVDDEELVARIVQRGIDSGRVDDKNESVIFNRILTYNKKTAPLKDYYNEQGKYHRIDGVGTMEEVFNRLEEVLNC